MPFSSPIATRPVSSQHLAKMASANLSPKTIINYTGLVKLVVASARDKEGELLFPRKWDSEFIDLPIVTNQHQPKFSSETMSSIVQKTTGQYRVLYAVLAGTGLRIGEALGLEVGKHISNDYRTIHVRQSVWEGSAQSPKAKAAVRDLDQCPSLSTMVKGLVAGRTNGFLFHNAKGRPLPQSNVLRRNLHPVLESLKQPKAGFHSFRR